MPYALARKIFAQQDGKLECGVLVAKRRRRRHEQFAVDDLVAVAVVG